MFYLAGIPATKLNTFFQMSSIFNIWFNVFDIKLFFKAIKKI